MPSDARSYRYLTNGIKEFLDDFYRREDGEFEKPENLQDIRDFIHSGNGSPKILAENRFRISLSSRQFSEAICKRIFYSSYRVAKLCSAVKALRAGGCASAWILTTSYYSSFFSAVEFLFLSGRFASYIDETDAAAVRANSAYSDFLIKKGSYDCEVNWSETDESVIISYAYGSDKPHLFAWEKMKQYVDSIESIPSASFSQWEYLRRILGSGGAQWRFPSYTRNTWNYTDSSLFGKRGEFLSREFLAHCAKPSLAVERASRGHAFPDEQSYATSMAYLQEVLVAANLDIARMILPAKRYAEIERTFLDAP